jgi:hypothetical protein
MKRDAIFPSNYLKAADLQGRTIRVTIEDVTMEKLGDDTKAVLHLVGKDKAIVLNKTNWTTLETMCQSEDSDHWRGWMVTLYPTKVPYQGKMVEAIRIDDRPGSAVAPTGVVAAPPPPPPPTSNDDDIPF